MAKAKKSLITPDKIERLILLIRGEKVMLDFDLAQLYGVSTGALNQAVKRHRSRFPDDFMFQLTWKEVEVLQSLGADGDSKPTSLRSQFVILKRGAHRKYRPYAFTEQGVA
ncbi:MAG: ORF6N domain-containing protein, partial [Planctomycetaceae bacterium]|nr:ORF6N domain-containing protein [Planctomycetaceae bacterium]